VLIDTEQQKKSLLSWNVCSMLISDHAY